jgi:hypothetical protein
MSALVSETCVGDGYAVTDECGQWTELSQDIQRAVR